MHKILMILLTVVSIGFAGCSSRSTAKVDASANLSTIKTMHVVKIPEETAQISAFIADDLRHRGYVVTTSAEKATGVDAVVTYVDRWMWDMSMYLLELTIMIRDPITDFPLATGNAMYTSLIRKSPPEMVDEVMGNIFKGVPK